MQTKQISVCKWNKITLTAVIPDSDMVLLFINISRKLCANFQHSHNNTCATFLVFFSCKDMHKFQTLLCIHFRDFLSTNFKDFYADILGTFMHTFQGLLFKKLGTPILGTFVHTFYSRDFYEQILGTNIRGLLIETISDHHHQIPARSPFLAPWTP